MSEVPDNGPTIVGVTWFLLLFSGSFLGVRLYAKLTRGQGLWWDDWILIFSWVMLTIESIITQYGQTLGFGKHSADINPLNLTQIAINTSIAASVSCFASTFSKISFGVTLLRLTTGWWKRFVWFAIITLFLVMLPSAINTWIQCTPAAKAFNNALEGNCWDPSITINYGIFNAAYCTIMDFALALLPWKLISGLQMNRKEKIGISVAMGLGVLSGICAIVKGIYVVQLRDQDFFFNGIDVTIWTATETATAIVAASVPVLRAIFKEKLSSRGYNKTYEGDLTLTTIGGSKWSDPRTEPRSTAKAPLGWAATVIAEDDHESDRSMLRDDHATRNGGILQTSSYFVDFHQADEISMREIGDYIRSVHAPV